MSKKATFEENMVKLESLVRRLEQGDATLEESMKLFEEGTKLAAALSKQLDAAEQKVRLMEERREGGLESLPFAGAEQEDDHAETE